MKRLIVLLFILPLLLSAGTLTLNLTFDQSSPSGFVTSPGRLRVPAFTINVLLPAGATLQEHQFSFGNSRSSSTVYDDISPAWASSESILGAPALRFSSSRYQFLGIKHWGDLTYASFSVLPYDSGSGSWQGSAELTLRYHQSPDARNLIPPSFHQPGFFINQNSLFSWYQKPQSRNYDFLVVGKPQHTAALSAWQSFRSSQGFVVQVENIDQILANGTGSTNEAKLRNYLISQYDASPFTYLLLVGDYDSVPAAYLTPEPGGSETVPSDFFYSDLSSNWDSNNNGLLGEYSSGAGQGDWGMDFTPEIFVGRLSTNDPTELSAIASRIVAYETGNSAYKHKALLPAAFLNYGGEPEPQLPQTDGAELMELLKAGPLRNFECSTMYEQTGYLPSYPSDYPLDYSGLNEQIRHHDYGIISWSAHGATTLSARKIWMNDDNGNNQPDPYEMQWLMMVDKDSFNGISTTGGSVLFAASCYNGQIDAQESSLAEYALIKKCVGAIGATRTGWYKPGWKNPGWGGLSSYNYHFLENYGEAGLSLGASHALTNLLHTQFYMFGDPLDTGGIIWPELQNVYTYLLYGDPAVGHSEAEFPQGEILVFKPQGSPDFRLINSIREISGLNVVFSDKFIPDYDYLNEFEAIFCLLDGYHFSPWEENLLNSYLDAGGKLYLEGAGMDFASNSIFYSKFYTIVGSTCHDLMETVYTANKHWITNSGHFGNYYALYEFANNSRFLFWAQNEPGTIYKCAIASQNQAYQTIASSMYLEEIIDDIPNSSANSFKELLAILLDVFGIAHNQTANADELIPSAPTQILASPNPSRGSLSIQIKNPAKHTRCIDIYNLRGQRVKTLQISPAKDASYIWDGKDASSRDCPGGIYIIKCGSALRKITLIR